MLDEKSMSEPAAGARGWVLFDRSCGFCSRWVRYWVRPLQNHGFEIAALQEDWVRKRLGFPAEEDLLLDLRLLLGDGRQVRGAEAYRYVMRRIWWAYPIYLLSVAPVLRHLFDRACRTFADNRYHFSRTCRIPVAAPDRRAAKSEE